MKTLPIPNQQRNPKRKKLWVNPKRKRTRNSVNVWQLIWKMRNPFNHWYRITRRKCYQWTPFQVKSGMKTELQYVIHGGVCSSIFVWMAMWIQVCLSVCPLSVSDACCPLWTSLKGLVMAEEHSTFLFWLSLSAHSTSHLLTLQYLSILLIHYWILPSCTSSQSHSHKFSLFLEIISEHHTSSIHPYIIFALISIQMSYWRKYM